MGTAATSSRLSEAALRPTGVTEFMRHPMNSSLIQIQIFLTQRRKDVRAVSLVLCLHLFTFTCSMIRACSGGCKPPSAGAGRRFARRHGRLKETVPRPVLSAELSLSGPLVRWCPSKPEVCFYVILRPFTVMLIIRVEVLSSGTI